MPYIKDKNLVNIYEEVDKANVTINKLNKLLYEKDENNAVLRKHRIVLGIFFILTITLFLWSFLQKDDKIDNNYLMNNNLAVVHNDTLFNLKQAVTNPNLAKGGPGINGEPIIYSIQIGAFTDLKAKLMSDNLAHMKEFVQGDINKYAIGNFSSYAEALMLKEDLIGLGFSDCFIIAQSYGDAVNIKAALQLSGETQYLK